MRKLKERSIDIRRNGKWYDQEETRKARANNEDEAEGIMKMALKFIKMSGIMSVEWRKVGRKVRGYSEESVGRGSQGRHKSEYDCN